MNLNAEKLAWNLNNNIHIKKDVVHTNIIEYYVAIKKNKILPFTTTWIDLENTMLSE